MIFGVMQKKLWSDILNTVNRIQTGENVLLNVVKNTIKSEGGCLDLTTCRGSTTRIVFQGVETGSRRSCWGILRHESEALFSFKTNRGKCSA